MKVENSDIEDILLKVAQHKKRDFLLNLDFLFNTFHNWKNTDSDVPHEEAVKVADAFQIFSECFVDPNEIEQSFKSPEELLILSESIINRFTLNAKRDNYAFSSRKRVQDVPDGDGKESWVWLYQSFPDMIKSILESINVGIEEGHIKLKSLVKGKDVSKKVFIEAVYGIIHRYVEDNLGGKARKSMTYYKKSVLTSYIAREYGYKMSRADEDIETSSIPSLELHGYVKYYLKKYNKS